MHVRRSLRVAVIALALLVAQAVTFAYDNVDFYVRGKLITLAVYRPAGKPKGTVFMGSGDVGWVGLATEMSQFLADQGYNVVGINIRQYLAAFTSGTTTLTTKESPDDYAQIAAFVRQRGLLVAPVIVGGVSEGAAMAVLAASSPKNHPWINGVLSMGLPPTAELGWRWRDAMSWITKKDADEPMFRPKDFLPQISPIPLCLIHSTKDEYVTEADYRLFERVAQEPKKFILINASNHRFTDQKDELKRQVMGCLTWIRSQPGV